MNQEVLRKIADYQMLHVGLHADIGLFSGKMGITIFFFHYARYSGLPIYEQFAEELLGEICEEIPLQMPIALGNGLCGIAWGIAYLHEYGFIEGELNEILSDMDERIMERNLLRLTDDSLETGYKGIALYISYRLDLSNGHGFPFDKTFINDFRKLCNRYQLSFPKDSRKIVLENMQNANAYAHIAEERWQEGLKYMCGL